MVASSRNSSFEIKPLSMIGKYNIQRFPQWNPEDTANWNIVKDENSKRPYAMYPTLGRAHINFQNVNQLNFGTEPRKIFKSINYWYAVVGNIIYRIDQDYETVNISGTSVVTISGEIYFTYLIVNSITFVVISDLQKVYIYQEPTQFSSEYFYVVTDNNAPGNYTINGIPTKPGYIATFGNRIVLSALNSSQFVLSQINLGLGSSNTIDPSICFTNSGVQIFASEEGVKGMDASKGSRRIKNGISNTDSK